jgi:vacuolar iron transporter family protein
MANLFQTLTQREPVYYSLPTTPMSASTISGYGDISKPSSRQHIKLPSLSRFLADFTLGFADGLTVPFALTAGLSSLGQTDTVILAGMAEIAAGSISMGIGGYLSARGEVATTSFSAEEKPQLGLQSSIDPEKAFLQTKSAVVADYLGPLHLPQELLDVVRSHIDSQPAITDALVRRQTEKDSQDDSAEDALCSPVLNGVSVALGYLLGGMLPLFPYFFVAEVVSGLKWSFGVCVLALFIFGFTKHYLLQEKVDDWSHAWHYHSRRWIKVKESAWEGLQMVVLGSIAAFAALLCVKASESIVS